MGASRAGDGRGLIRTINTLTRQGHSFEDIVGRYSPELVNLLADEAIEYDRHQSMRYANLIAIGAGVASTGKMDGLKRLEKDLGIRRSIDPGRLVSTIAEVAERGQASKQRNASTRARNKAMRKHRGD